MIYNAYDVVLVPFPFTDRNVNKKRPALVVNKPDYQIKTGHLVLLMITSAKNSGWENDIEIQDLKIAGLPCPSVVRHKLFSLDERIILKKLGSLSKIDKNGVNKGLSDILSL